MATVRIFNNDIVQMDELKELKLDMKVGASGCDVDANGVWCAWGLCWTGYWK